MEARATVKHIRVSPRKVGIVLDLIRGQNAEKAMAILQHTPRSACEPVGKLLKSAIHNAEENHHMNRAELFVAECICGPGTTLKRIRPRAHGRAYHILKRTSHITLVLREKE